MSLLVTFDSCVDTSEMYAIVRTLRVGLAPPRLCVRPNKTTMVSKDHVFISDDNTSEVSPTV